MRALNALAAVLAALLAGCAGAPVVPAPARLALGEIDRAELALRAVYAPPLRWFNVEAGGRLAADSAWVAGIRPAWSARDRQHHLSLAPGQATTLRLAPRQRLRVVSPTALDDDALLVTSRNESGLARPEAPRATADRRTLLVDPARDEPALVEIAVPAGGVARTLTLYLEDRASLSALLPLRTVLTLPGATVGLRNPATEAVATDYHAWPPEAPLALDVAGHRRVRVSAYFRYETSDTRPLRSLQLTARSDTGEVAHLDAYAERVRPLLVDEQPALLSGRFDAWLEIPEGVRRVTLSTAAPVLVRVTADEARDYLLPALNAPVPALNAPVPAPTAPGPTAGQDPLATARSALSDNRHREGGAVGSARLAALAAATPGEPALGGLARAATGARTFFRDLRPAGKPNRGDARVLSFLLPAGGVADEARALREEWLRDSHVLAPWRERIAAASFTPLAPGETQHYLLPARAAPGELRVMIPAGEAPGAVMLQFNDATPRRLEPRPATAGPAAGTTVPPASGALVPDDTIVLTPMAVSEVPLPGTVREIRVWPATTGGALEVALQYRAPRVFELDEASYPALLADLDGDPLEALRALATRGEGPATLAPALANHWEPLARWLRAARAQFEWPVRAAPAPTGPDGDPVARTALEARATATTDPVAAVEAWSAALRATPPAGRTAGEIARALALLAAGEPYLAEQALAGPCVHGRDAAERERACAALDRIYVEGADDENRAGLLAMRFLRAPTEALASTLVATLLTIDEGALALDLGLALPPAARPAGLGAAALARGWTRTAQALGATGPAGFTPADARIVDYAGAETLYAIERDAYATAYRAEPGTPVRLVVDGPTTLAFEFRPLHTASESAPLDGWVEIRDADELVPVALTANRATPTLRLVGRPGVLPGRRVRTELPLGPGRHALTVAARPGPVLVRVEETRPPPPASTAADALSPAWPEAALLARGEGIPALELHAGPSLEDALRRALLANWLADADPATRPALLATVSADFARHPGSAALRGLLGRLERDAAWEAVGTVVSAGLREVPLEGWSPETPSLRIRRALLAGRTAAAPGTVERLLAHAGRLVYAADNLAPSTLAVTLDLASLPYAPPVPATLAVHLDDRPPLSVRLDADRPRRSLRLELPVGSHRLRVDAGGLPANQFVRIRLRESRTVPPVGFEARTWHVATAREPLRASVVGPAWLRIDELRGEETRSEYRLLGQGAQVVELRPTDGASEALYRLFQRLPGDVVPPRPAAAERNPVAVAAPRFVEASPAPDAEVAFVDAYPLRHQEDGLWSFGARAQRRRDVDFAGPDDPSAEQFLEASLTHRRVDDARRNYRRETLLARAREFGGPTLGGDVAWVHLPASIPVGLRVGGTLFVQQPDGDDVEAAAAFEAALYQVRPLAPTLYHVPQAGTFARWLTLEGNPDRLSPGATDQDLFTTYKGDHQYGWQLGDTLHWLPWLDTELEAGLLLSSNENLSPDYLRWRVAGRQRLGPARLVLEYRATHGFDDVDRRNAFTRHVVRGATTAEVWRNAHGWLEIGVNASRDFRAHDWYGGLELVWHHGAARGYRDFLPGERDFETLDTRDLARRPENRVRTDGVD